MSAHSKHKQGQCVRDKCWYCLNEAPEWDGKCHGCMKQIMQPEVARIGPYWICERCLDKHFPDNEYSVNQASEILEKIRGFK